MKNWWLRRSLRFRLTVWYAGLVTSVLAILACACLAIVSACLWHLLDRELHSDYDDIEEGLVDDGNGHLSWTWTEKDAARRREMDGPQFEVWKLDGTFLYRNGHFQTTLAQHPAVKSRLEYYSLDLPGMGPTRVLLRIDRFGGPNLLVRVYRSEKRVQRITRILTVVWLGGFTAAIVLAAAGGYLVADRALQPIKKIAARARKITAESLRDRLPIQNANDELGHLAQVFNLMLERLEMSFTELRRFTSDASHELRTPLTALRAIGEVALRDQTQDLEGLRETIATMLESADRLSAMVESLLTLARADHEKPRQLQRIDAQEFAETAADTVRVLSDEKDQRITVVTESEHRIVAKGDSELLSMALFNILDNAIRYSPIGTQITVRVGTVRNYVLFEVEDEGPGIAREHQDRIFDRFYRPDYSRAQHTGGVGLGLAIARSAIRLQGGNIEVRNRTGGGAVFRITLPIGPAEPQPRPMTAEV
jgi:heavy metal sensor kinase